MKVLLPLLYVASWASAHVINGRHLIRAQRLEARASKDFSVAGVLGNLDQADNQWIDDRLLELAQYNGLDCDVCKHTIKFSRELYDSDADHQHLISLMLFKKCIQLQKNPSKCNTVDFFVTTDYDNWTKKDKALNLSINFWDNDFLQMLKHFDVNNDDDLLYYCYYKHSVCDLPKIDINKFGIDEWWPAKQDKHYLEPQYKHKNKNARKHFNVLHISDFHLQLSYRVGTEANCTTGTCCAVNSYNKDLPLIKNYNISDYYDAIGITPRDFSFYPNVTYLKDGTYNKGDYVDYIAENGWDYVLTPATPFGHYLCDLPEVLLNISLAQIGETQKKNKYDFCLFTGDLVDHIKGLSSPENTLQEETRSFQLMKEYFENIPVLPALGNHDTFPYGQVAPPQLEHNQNYTWDDDAMAELWINNGWINGAKREDLKSHLLGFSYVTERGLKVIILNLNTYYQKNLWGYINCTSDPDLFGTWKWLVSELVALEACDQRVWIAAHIPPNDNDAKAYQSQIFEKIVQRFSPYTIAGIFYGHTHRDQVFVSYQNDQPAAFALVAPLITPGTNNNPGWRYYEVEDELFNIVNAHHYYLALNETLNNNGDLPQYKYEYLSRDLYDPKHQWPADAPLNATFWHQNVVKPINDTLAIAFNQEYIDLQYRYSPFAPKCLSKKGNLTKTCLQENWCVVSTFNLDLRQKCLDAIKK